LLNHLEEVAYDAGVKRLHLDASLSARNFYSKHGYIICEGEVAIELTLGGRLVGIPMAKDLCG